MSRKNYSSQQFHQDFPDEQACLEWLKIELYSDGVYCSNCSKITNHHFIKSRKSYSCQECGRHVYPTSKTIFYKSSTPLPLWFYAIYLIGKTHGTITVREIQYELGVTYKTAWRINKLIREQLTKND